ncbi:hypothetical protein ACOM2C_09285 [Pseudarthrobacter sp. So.54]
MEIEAEREAELTREILERMAAAQTANSDRHRHAIRDAHAKSHAILKATLRMHEKLAPEPAQGIFANPGSFPAVVRLSSSPGDIHPDRVPAPRGFATKVIGVPGERLLPALGGHNQDFLMVNFPVLAFGTIGKYQQMLTLLEKNAAAPDFFQRIVAGTARLAEGAVQAVGATPNAALQGMARDNNNMLGETYRRTATLPRVATTATTSCLSIRGTACRHTSRSGRSCASASRPMSARARSGTNRTRSTGSNPIPWNKSLIEPATKTREPHHGRPRRPTSAGREEV